ncbi:MAG TPA: FAD-dependent oxidoreductase [Anaeromyxobacter sp.]|nr:FAD-dependent oxidoreductase [Anaeromyxobacter sp.]
MAEPPLLPVLVVGAGVSGLSCGRALADGGQSPTLLERARGVGGRCATRRVNGHALDFGATFLHGRDPDFLAALKAVPATALPFWPREVSGSGLPCQPEAFSHGEWRVAFAEGASALPKHLARGLEVWTLAAAEALEPASGSVRVRLEDGTTVRARTVVVATAAEEAEALLATAPAERELSAATAVLRLSRSEPCLALLAVYPEETAAPTWQLALPERSRILQLASSEGTKRRLPSPAVVYQAHARWSREHAEDRGWPRALLDEAGRVLGPWAAAPRVVEEHRWRYARNGLSAELAAPILLRLNGGGLLGLCGDRFGRGGGVEGAWLSGRTLARRILAEEGG